MGIVKEAMYTLPDDQEKLKEFLDRYTLEKIVAPSLKSELKPKSERRCRFCKDKRQNMRFEGRSHFIPQFLGNEDLLSDFECDACNKYFAPLENQFANSLGMMRTIWALTRGGKVPAFPSPSGVAAKKEIFFGVNGISISQPEFGDGFNYNAETGHFEVWFDKHSYTPLHVYKILLKLALSTISDGDVQDYDRAFQFLMTNEKTMGWCQILSRMSPPFVRVKEPACILFRKREYNDLLPTHIFMLSFENMTYQFPLPFNIKDKAIGLYNNKPVIPIFCPPTFQEPPVPGLVVMQEPIDLSSPEPVVREKGKISWDTDPQLMAGLIAFDPITGENKDVEFDPKTLVRIHITNENGKPTFPFFNKDNEKNDNATNGIIKV